MITANRDARPASTVGQAVSVLDMATIERRQAVIVSDLVDRPERACTHHVDKPVHCSSQASASAHPRALGYTV